MATGGREATGATGMTADIDTDPRDRGVSRAPQPRRRRSCALPLVAIVLALIVGSVVIIFSELAGPGPWTRACRSRLQRAARGSLGSVTRIVNTLINAIPLLLGGLAVGLGFKAGLFNIGAQGQFLMGALGCGHRRRRLRTSPVIVAVPLSLLAGVLFGAAWGFIPGFLKAVSGAHEVVTTIMLNSSPSRPGRRRQRPLKLAGSPSPRDRRVGNAALPIIFGRNGTSAISSRSSWPSSSGGSCSGRRCGFEIRTVGANPDAARYAGMSPARLIILTMSLCGHARRPGRRGRPPRRRPTR